MRDLDKLLKTEEKNLEMLKNTLSQMIEMGSNNTKKVEELVENSTKKIELLKRGMETEKLFDEFYGDEMSDTKDATEVKFSIGNNEKADKIVPYLVRSDDFMVYFDDVDIDGKFVRCINDSRDDLHLSITMSSYIIPENKEGGNLEKYVDSLLGSKIGTIRIQYPGVVCDDKYTIKEYRNCELSRYYTSPFDYSFERPRYVILEIKYCGLKFIDNETTDKDGEKGKEAKENAD